MDIKDLYVQYPFKSVKKFVPIALEHGFSRQDAEKFLKTVTHDVKHNPRDYYLPIYSEVRNGFQFDTLVQTKRANPRYFLIVININSRKIYAYPMKKKNSSDVLQALKLFTRAVKRISSMTSDQDQAYLSKPVIEFMKSHGIDYRTTTKHDHTRLGIINRAIRTLRDLNHERDFTVESMNRVVKAYNSSVHSSTDRKPDKFTKDDEEHYVHKMRALTDTRKQTIPVGSYVRTVNPKGFGKRRSNLSDRKYMIDSMIGYKYLLRAADNSVATYPRHQLVISDPQVPMAETIDNDSHGIIEKILDYKNKKYHVLYEGGKEDHIKPMALRESRPTMMSEMEKEFWKNKDIPPELL